MHDNFEGALSAPYKFGLRPGPQALGLIVDEIHPQEPGFGEMYEIVSQAEHPDARHLCDLWTSAEDGFRIGRDVPSRKLARLLSHLAIYEPLVGDFRIRLAGAALLRRHGSDISGRLLSELYRPSLFARMEPMLRAILDSGEPCIADVKATQHGHLRLHFEVVVLPVIAADGETPWLMSGVFYRDWAAKSHRAAQKCPAFYGMASL